MIGVPNETIDFCEMGKDLFYTDQCDGLQLVSCEPDERVGAREFQKHKLVDGDITMFDEFPFQLELWDDLGAIGSWQASFSNNSLGDSRLAYFLVEYPCRDVQMILLGSFEDGFEAELTEET